MEFNLMLKLEMPSPTSLNRPKVLPRVVKAALEWRHELWYWQGELFDGYMYDIVNQRNVEIWRVEAGQVVGSYFPEEFVAFCQAYHMSNLPIIDITGFSFDNYSGITHYQTLNHPYYQDGMTYEGVDLMVDGLPYTGMVISTEENIVTAEKILIDGFALAGIYWEFDGTFELSSIFVSYLDFSWAMEYVSKHLVLAKFFLYPEKDQANFDIDFIKTDQGVFIKSINIEEGADFSKIRNIIHFNDNFLFDYDFYKKFNMTGTGVSHQIINNLIEKDRLSGVETLSIYNFEKSADFFIALAKIESLKILRIEPHQYEESKALVEEFQKLRPDVSITE